MQVSYEPFEVWIVRDGHAVGNHSFFHARMPLLSGDGIRADVGEATGVIEAITESARAQSCHPDP